MLSFNDFIQYFKNNVTEDAFYKDNSSDINEDLINQLIADSYSELEPIEDYIPSDTLDIYAKVLTSVSLLDRFGVSKGAFPGLDEKEAFIRNLIKKSLEKRISNNQIKTKTSDMSVKDDSVKIISDEFIEGFLS